MNTARAAGVHVAVVGGGWAGMAAAAALADGGAAVTVYEAGPIPGGRARRVEVNGVALDNGLHILIGAYREALRMIARVNPDAGPALLRLPLKWNLPGEFRLAAPRLPAPLNVLVALLAAQGIDWPEKRAAAGLMLALRRARYRVPRELTVETLLARHGQSARLNRLLWYPLCVAALNTPPASASAQVFVNVLRDGLAASRAASDLVLARTDLSALFPEPAARYVQERGGRVRTGCRVTAIEPVEDGGFMLETGAGPAARREHYTHVVCALPPHQVNAFLIGLTALSEIAEAVERLEYEPIYSVWLQYPGSVKLPEAMLGCSEGPLQWVFDREALCGQRGLLGAVISASGAHQALAQDALAQAVHAEINRRFGPLPAPLWTRVIAEKRATFACTPRADATRPPQLTPLRHFYLAGDYTQSDYPATLEAAVRSGLSCAAHILQGPAAINRVTNPA